MKTLQWKEPPPAPRRANSETQEVMAQLKANPGRWALLAEDAKSQSAANTWKKHGCETTVRRNEKNPKHFDVYVRVKSAAAAPATATRPGPRPAPAVPKPAVPSAAPSAEPSAPSGDPGLDSYMAKRRQRTGAGSVNGL